MLFWDELPYETQMHKMLQARHDPVFFCEDPYFLNLNLWPVQKEIIRRFILGVPKEMPVDEWFKLRDSAIRKNKLDKFTEKHIQWYYDLVVVAGMNGSKTFTTSCIGLQQAFELLCMEDPVKYYGAAPGTEFFVLNVATSDDQAHDTIFAQEKGKIDNSPYFQYLKPREKYNQFKFPDKHVTIRCGGSNSASLVGRAVKAGLFDELARFKDTKGERSGWAVYHGLGRGTKKVPALKARRVAISSTLFNGDIIDQLYKMSFRVPTMLGLKYTTWEMNPTITKETLADDFAKDPTAAWRDYGAQPSRAIEKYYGDTSIIKFNETRSNPVLSTPIQSVSDFTDRFIGSGMYDYVATGDPAVKMDSFGIAMGHLDEHDKIIIDFVYRIAPKLEVDPSEVKLIVDVLKSRFNLVKFIVDQWNYPETLARIRDSGIEIEFHVVKLQEHDRLKEAWRNEEIDCYEYQRLRDELEMLEIHRGRRVDHPRKGSKDVADAVAQLVWELKGKPKEQKPFQPRFYRPIVMKHMPIINRGY